MINHTTRRRRENREFGAISMSTTTPNWMRQNLMELLPRNVATDHYVEFLKIPSLRTGVYVLPAGGADPQTPHTQDEVYYVVRGLATLLVAGERCPATPGDTLFVKAGVEHRFVDIREELVLLVFFSAAESK